VVWLTWLTYKGLTLPCRGGLKLCGTPGWNVERGDFYKYETVVNGDKVNERTEVFVLLKQKSLSKKTNLQLIRTSQYEWNSLILSLVFLLETWNDMDKCSPNIFLNIQWHPRPTRRGTRGTVHCTRAQQVRGPGKV